MPRTRVFRTASFRLTAIYGLCFAISSIALGAGVYRFVHAEVAREFDERIEEESDSLHHIFATKGAAGLASVLSARDAGGLLNYGLQAPDGRLIAGGARAPLSRDGAPTLGWVEMPEDEVDEAPEGEPETLRALVTRLSDGDYLVVGDERRRPEKAMRDILMGFGWATAAALALAVAGGLWTSAQFLRRIEAMRGAALGLMGGDWSRRIVVGDVEDDLAALAKTFNRLFERIEKLLLANKHVSADIAHDLRKPLSRTLRRLEATAAFSDLSPQVVSAIEGAIADIESVLKTFDALLRIGQIEAGARRAKFRAVDLSEIAHEIAEAFRPSAEDEGRRLLENSETPFVVQGDRDLLVQMVANLIDNALRHTLPGTAISISTEQTPAGPQLNVADNGPGVPESLLTTIFKHYYRADAAALTGGTGLGLALVAAIAEMHDLECWAADNQPGLRLTIQRRADAAAEDTM